MIFQYYSLFLWLDHTLFPDNFSNGYVWLHDQVDEMIFVFLIFISTATTLPELLRTSFQFIWIWVAWFALSHLWISHRVTVFSSSITTVACASAIKLFFCPRFIAISFLTPRFWAFRLPLMLTVLFAFVKTIFFH